MRERNLFRRGGTYYARIKVRGRDIRTSLRTRNLREARQRLGKILKDIDHLRFYGEARHTWKEATGRWMAEFLLSVKPATRTRYMVSIGQLHPYLGALYVDEITRRTVAGIISARKKTAATNATIRRDLTAMSSILSCCVAWGWRDDNPAKDFDRSIIRERRAPIRPPTDDEILKLCGVCPTSISRLIRFLRYTGMRQEEAVGLEWRDIDLSRRQVTLLRTKTNRPRVVSLDEQAWGTIEGTPRHINSPYVFWHGDGDRYHSFASRFAALTKRAGVRFRCHDLRHKFAIDYLKDGGDIYALSRILGHASVKTTEMYLGYVDAESAQQLKGSNQ